MAFVSFTHTSSSRVKRFSAQLAAHLCFYANICLTRRDKTFTKLITAARLLTKANAVSSCCLQMGMKRNVRLDLLQFFDRLTLFGMPDKHQPDFIYLRHVPLRKVHLFTIIQLTCLILLWVIKTSKAAIVFPMMVSGRLSFYSRNVQKSQTVSPTIDLFMRRCWLWCLSGS